MALPATGLSYEEALARIPVDGTARQPLYWRLDDPSDPRAAPAVRAVRHYLALAAFSQPLPEDYLELMAAVETAWRVERQRPHMDALSTPHHDPLVGPSWIWVMDAWVEGDSAAVLACRDIGFYGRVSERAGQEPPRDRRWLLELLDLVREPDADGVPRWKVDSFLFSSGLTTEDYPDLEAAERRCEEWADHPLNAAG